MSQQRPENQEIRKMLIQLHDELAQAQDLDDDERAMMRHLTEDIQAMLKRSEQTGARVHPSPSIIERLQKSIDDLEASHPTLAAAVHKVLDTLNIAGI